jgi:hypothetical protein
VQQWIDAASPSNFLALNPEALKKAIDTKGESIATGLQHLLEDVRKGHVSQTDESGVRGGPQRGHHGRQVVFENELFQLIEYKPLTAKVHERPMLFVPPCINKYYILDLQPENSVIRWTRGAGPPHLRDELAQPRRLDGRTWAGTTTSSTARWPPSRGAGHHRRETLNTLGFCVGGTILSHRAGGAGGARPAPGAVGDAADHAAGLCRHRHPRHLHRRGHGADARDDAGRAGPRRPGAAEGPGTRHHLQLPAPQRPGLELRGRQLPQGRKPAAL